MSAIELRKAIIAGASKATTRPSYRFIRIYITANNGDAYTSVQQLELATSVGGVDITNPSMVCNESDYNNPLSANWSKVIDNDFSNPFNSYISKDKVSTPHWGYIDLGVGNAKAIVELRMWAINYSGVDATRSPKDFLVQGSNDATNWTTIKSFTNITGWSQGVGKTFVL